MQSTTSNAALARSNDAATETTAEEGQTKGDAGRLHSIARQRVILQYSTLNLNLSRALCVTMKTNPARLYRISSWKSSDSRLHKSPGLGFLAPPSPFPSLPLLSLSLSRSLSLYPILLYFSPCLRLSLSRSLFFFFFLSLFLSLYLSLSISLPLSLSLFLSHPVSLSLSLSLFSPSFSFARSLSCVGFSALHFSSFFLFFVWNLRGVQCNSAAARKGFPPLFAFLNKFTLCEIS